MSRRGAIDRGRVREAYAALELEPALWEWTARIEITADGVRVERLKRGADGKPIYRKGAFAVDVLELDISG